MNKTHKNLNNNLTAKKGLKKEELKKNGYKVLLPLPRDFTVSQSVSKSVTQNIGTSHYRISSESISPCLKVRTYYMDGVLLRDLLHFEDWRR